MTKKLRKKRLKIDPENKENINALLNDRSFLEQEYIQNQKSIKEIAIKVGCYYSKVSKALRRYSIKLRTVSEIRHLLSDQKSSEVLDNFLYIRKPEVAYLLGLIWADGYLNNSIYENHCTYRVSVNNVLADAYYFLNIFKKTGFWRTHIIPAKPNGSKAQLHVVVSNKRLYDFLYNCDYGPGRKSIENQNKILSKIPLRWHYLFWRGLSDGDGCFYFSDKGRCRFTLASHINQNWSCFSNLLTATKIKYNIRKNIRQSGNGSCLHISCQEDIVKFGDYIYQDYNDICLPRKREKYLQIKNRYLERTALSTNK
jgi:hypothetical protein